MIQSVLMLWEDLKKILLQMSPDSLPAARPSGEFLWLSKMKTLP